MVMCVRFILTITALYPLLAFSGCGTDVYRPPPEVAQRYDAELAAATARLDARHAEEARVKAEQEVHLQALRGKRDTHKKLTKQEAETLAQADEEIAKREAAAAAEEQYQQKLQKLGSQEAAMQADALECQMQGQMAAAAASNPRALIDLVALATGAQVRDTCLRMKALRWQASGVQ